MRKILGILFILVCSVQCTVYAVTYQTYRPASGTSFRSTSAYIAPTGTPYTVHCTPSTMSSTVHCTPYTVHSTPSTVHQSLSAISASNFTALNSEGGAFYRASSVKPHIRRDVMMMTKKAREAMPSVSTISTLP